MNMAKKIVKVDEDAVRGYMVAAMTDKPSRNDNAREEDTSSEVESEPEPVGIPCRTDRRHAGNVSRTVASDRNIW